MPTPSLLAAAAPPIVLASASAIRARLLDAAGVPVAQRPATVDEIALKESLQAEGASAGDAALALAELKAQQIARHMPDAIVLGADQILTCAGRWFDKPQDRAQSRAQLGALAGKRHELATAVVAFRGGVRVWHHLAMARLWLRPCSPGFLDAYLDAVGAAALISVGAYQIEHLGAQLLARIEGDHFAVLGLPVLEVLEFLRQQGVLLR
ncbi:MAG: Maf family protein [Geminicoccaceae bacterium]